MTRWLSGVWDRFVNYERSTAPPQNTKADKPHTGTHPLGERVTDGNGMLLPQYRTFTGIYNEATKMYSSRFDEAIRAGYENAYAIERDAFVWSLIQERVLPLTRWKWEVTADPNDVQKKTTVPVNPAAPTQNGKDPYSDAREQVRRALEACVSETHDLHQIRFSLGLATYYGRYGTQMRWDRRQIGGYRRVIAGYTQPLHGDKIHYTHDGIPGVMIIATDKAKYQEAGIDVRTFDAFGPAVILSNPAQRNRFIIHKHFLLDANYTDIQAAGKVHGIGYRDFMYWNWWLRDEMIAWVMDFLQKVGNLGLLLFYYEEGNPASQAAAKKAAEESSGQNALTVPFPKGKDPGTAKVELLTANTSGAQLLLDIISQWFERHIERLWVGQSMSSGADNESGLGGTGRADFARDTKHNLLMFDAENQANTFTQDLVRPIKEHNFAEVPWRYKWTYRVPDPSAKEKLDGVQKLMQFLPFVADDVYDLVGVRKPDEGDVTVGGPQAQPGQGDTPGGDGMGFPVPGGGPADSPHEGSTPGMGELVAAMMRAAADGDWKTVRELRLLGVDPEGLAGVVDDLEGGEQAPEGQPVDYAGRAGLVDYEWVRAQTKAGKVKAVWSGSGERRALYGQRAEQALKAKTGTPGEQVEQPREKARRLKDEREPRRQQAREVYRKAIENPAGVQPHELADLEEHLKTLTRNEIREALRVQGEKTFGKLKDELVQGLLGYVRVDDMPPAPSGRDLTPEERDEAGEAMARDDALGKVREDELQAKPQEIQPEDQPYLDRIEDRMRKAAEWSGDRPESMVAEEFGRRAQGELERFQDRYEGKPQPQGGQTPVAQEPTNRGPLTAGEIATYKMKAREKAEHENKVLASIKRANRKLERLASEQENIKSYFRNASSAGVPVPENFREAYKRNAEEIEKHTQAIEKMKSGMSSTPGDWMSIMADMIVADHPGLYEKHEQYKADGTPFLGFKQKDNPTPPEPTPQQKPPAQTKKERKPRKQRKEPRKLSDYIKSSGGIDPDSHDFKRHFRDMKEAMQNGIPMSVFRRGGRGLDELAESLHREGAVIVPEGVDPSQHVIDELQKKAYSQLEDMTDYWDRKLEEHYRMEEEQRREEEEYARTYGRSEVSRLSEEADRAGQAQALGEFEEDPFGESEIEYREPVEGEEYDDSFDFGFNAVSEQPDEPNKSDLYTGEYQLDIFGNKQPIPKTIKPPVQPSLIPTEIDRQEDVRQAEEILGEWAKRSGNTLTQQPTDQPAKGEVQGGGEQANSRGITPTQQQIDSVRPFVHRDEPFHFSTNAPWAGKLAGLDLRNGELQDHPTAGPVIRFSPVKVDGKYVNPIFKVTPERKELADAWSAHQQANADKSEAAKHSATIMLSSRGGGDYSLLEWTGDIRMSDEEILGKMQEAYDASHDVDTPFDRNHALGLIAAARQKLNVPTPQTDTGDDDALSIDEIMDDENNDGVFFSRKKRDEARQGEQSQVEGTPQPTPKEGDRNAEGLVFRDGRWRREGEGDPSRKWAKNDDGTYTAPNGTVWKKAAAGGEISPVTGERFAGGKLMPIHGKSVGMDVEGVGGEGGATVGQGGRREREKKKELKPKQKRTKKARNKDGQLVDIPDDHISLESIVGGGPWHSRRLTDESLAYLGIDRETANAIADASDRGIVSVPRDVVGDGRANKAALLAALQSITPSPQADTPKEGDRNAEGLVFRDGRWRREGEGDTTQEVTRSAVPPTSTDQQDVIRYQPNDRAAYRDANDRAKAMATEHATRLADAIAPGDEEFKKWAAGGNMMGSFVKLVPHVAKEGDDVRRVNRETLSPLARERAWLRSVKASIEKNEGLAKKYSKYLPAIEAMSSPAPTPANDVAKAVGSGGSGESSPETPREQAATSEATTRPAQEESERVKPIAPGVGYSDIPYGTAFNAYRNISFSPERRAQRVQDDYIEQMNRDYEYLSRYAEGDEQKEQLKAEFARYKDGYRSKFMAVLAAKSRTASPMITGPARFPTESNRKRLDAESNRYQELKDFRESALKAIAKKFPKGRIGLPVASNDPEAIQTLTKKLEEARKFQETAKQANAIIRKHVKKVPGKYEGGAYTPTKYDYKPGKSQETAIAELSSIGIPEKRARELLTPDFAGRIGFADYELTNNNARIKQVEARIASIQAMKSRPGGESSYSGGVTVVEDPDAARIRIKFPGKPDRNTISQLKSRGFRWSPSEGAWQRHLNSEGRSAVESVLKSLGHEKMGQASTENESVPEMQVSLGADDAGESNEGMDNPTSSGPKSLLSQAEQYVTPGDNYNRSIAEAYHSLAYAIEKGFAPKIQQMLAENLEQRLQAHGHSSSTAPPQNPPVSYQRWDEADHPRDDEGKFTTGDGGGSSSTTSRDTSKATASWEKWEAEVGRIDAEHAQAREAWVNEVDRLDAEHAEAVETWEARSEARQAGLDAVSKTEFGGIFDHFTNMDVPDLSLESDEGKAAEINRIQSLAEGAVTELQAEHESVVARLTGAGANEKELAPLAKVVERGSTTLSRLANQHGKALKAYQEFYQGKYTAVMNTPEPEEPDPDDFATQEEYDAAQEKYESLHEKWEDARDEVETKLTDKYEQDLWEIQSEISVTIDDITAKYEEQLSKTQEKVAIRLQKEDDADAYPKEPTYPDEPDDPEYPEEPEEEYDDEEEE